MKMNSPHAPRAIYRFPTTETRVLARGVLGIGSKLESISSVNCDKNEFVICNVKGS